MGRPISGNRFTVSIGPINISFAKVRNISKEIQYDVLKEGGVNDYPHVLQKPYVTPHKLIFERGISDGSLLTTLTPLLVGKKLPSFFSGTITVKNSKGDAVGSYSFADPIITKWSLGELDALNDKILIETLEVVHSGISVSAFGILSNALF